MDITDEYMQKMIASTRAYTVVILKKAPGFSRPDVMRFVWEHGRRNFSLRAEGKLVIVCPVNDGSEVSGIGIFNTSEEETKAIMDGDPGVQEGIFLYEIHASRSFPGDALP